MTQSDGFAPPPAVASWRFTGVRRGAERVRFTVSDRGVRAVGTSRGVDLDEGMPWRIRYDLTWDHRWRFRRAVVRGRDRTRFLTRDAHGWTVDGIPEPAFAACPDLDLQVSLLTNTAPVHRAVDRRIEVDATAVYLTSTLDLEVLPQTYRRLPGPGRCFAYDSPAHDYRATLGFDPDGLVRDYPFLGRRT